MNKYDLVDVLRSMGISEKAATLYACLLGKRRMTISDIARVAGTKRATCYEYIDELLAREFILRSPVGKRMYFSAADPRRILTELRRTAAQFEKDLPALTAMHDAGLQKPKITFFEGKRELRRIYDDMFKTVGEVHSIFPTETFFQNFTEQEYEEFDKAITDHALKSKDLFVVGAAVKKIRTIREKNGVADKVDKVLPSWFNSNVDVLIYSEKVALISLRDLSAIVIENKDIADLFRNLHTGLWKQS